MASACSRIAQRTLFSSAKSVIKSNFRASSKPTSTSVPLRQSLLTRISPELRCAQSLLPLHSAVAAARMTSCLSVTSRSCRALSQGPMLWHIVIWILRDKPIMAYCFIIKAWFISAKVIPATREIEEGLVFVRISR
ncbi:protein NONRESPONDING TO OXYLIPINS 2, mitochondrial-like isoform X2 [Vigna umbellata]|uniref:protein NONRESPONDING TO OXYLIPINS 2, mitochondrial-like isoform X2 n=1 Tax=Vigna umbellata TaxID=87088 RepID=UPI001F5F8D59|nr:protein NONRESPONDING TO OXYLIPINS 2, mitochondrial-like isoform X2 [Vigna umbellata]